MNELKLCLLGVTACTLLTACAEQLAAGALRRCVQLIGGLLLLLSLLVPAARLKDSLELPDYSTAYAPDETALRETFEASLCDGIAAETETYIEEKAAALGTPVRADAEVAMRGGVPTLVRITLQGAYSEAVDALVENEFALTEEKRLWIPVV